MTELKPTRNDHETGNYVEVPVQELSAIALRGLIESYVLREGTDYGANEYSLSAKVERVKQQLDRGEVAIVFNIETNSADIMTRREIARNAAENRVSDASHDGS